MDMPVTMVIGAAAKTTTIMKYPKSRALNFIPGRRAIMSPTMLIAAIPRNTKSTAGIVKKTTRFKLPGILLSYRISEKKERENSTVSTHRIT